MVRKNKIKNLAALLLGATFAVAGAGCDTFFTTNNEKDMQQTVAEVNIANYINETDLKDTNLGSIVEGKGLTTEISKRDLVASFLNVGSTYVNNYGYSYRQTFELLMDSLVGRKIMVQYAVAYYLKNDETKTATDCVAKVNEETQNAEGKEQELLKAHPEVLTMKYFLGQKEYDTAVYSLKKALNDSLDSLESGFINEEEHEHDTAEARTLPTNVGTEKADYYTTDYKIYTGRESVGTLFGAYEKLDGSVQATRLKAYNKFLANLSANNLILKGEDTSDFTKLDYYYVELASQLEQALITQFGEDLTKKAEEELTLDFIKDQYDLSVEAQTATHKDLTAFETALDGVSDTSFVLNAPEANYGFVYNILIPFSAWQTEQYTQEKSKGFTKAELFAKRAEILNNIVAKDLRDTWFSEDEHANYAYENGGKYYFFEDQTGANKNLDKYEALTMYAGSYAYDGTVEKSEDGEYTVKPTVRKIDNFLSMMEGYMQETLQKTYPNVTVSGGNFGNYVTDAKDYKMNEKKDDFTDYSQFIYYEGKVAENGNKIPYNVANHFVKDTLAYDALSLFNELMFAYSTDTGCLNTYMGYVVSPFETSFVSEFEYAAQYAIRELGVGGYVVCPSDYGWHIIYVSSVLPVNNVYGDADLFTNEIFEAEDGKTFYDFYYASLKSASAQRYQERVQNEVLEEYDNGSSVKLYEDRYEDLLSIGE